MDGDHIACWNWTSREIRITKTEGGSLKTLLHKTPLALSYSTLQQRAALFLFSFFTLHLAESSAEELPCKQCLDLEEGL